MAIDKSLRQHYETQGGVKNYLGKQKMVKAPKHWLSKPGHVKAKLAYITDEEEQILIDKNLYGSLRGRPNIGPAGLPSLQGGDFGAGGGGGSSGGGGNGGGGGPPGGGDRGMTYSAPAPAPAPRPSPHRDPVVTKPPEFITRSSTPKPAPPTPRGGGADVMDIPPSLIETVNPFEETKKAGIPIDKLINPHADSGPVTKQQVKTDLLNTKIRDSRETGEIDDRTKEGKEELEKWENKQDWDVVDTLVDKGADFTQLNTLIDQGLLEKGKTQPIIEQSGMPGLINSLVAKSKTFIDPRSMAKTAAKNFMLKKLGLSWLNPFLGIGSFLLDRFAPGKKEAFKSKFAYVPTTKQTTEDLVKHEPRDGDGIQQTTTREDVKKQREKPKNVIEAGIQEYTLTPEQKEIALKRRGMVQNILDEGSYQGNELTEKQINTLTKYIAQIDAYLVPVEDVERAPEEGKWSKARLAAYGGRIDGPLMGRSRYI